MSPYQKGIPPIVSLERAELISLNRCRLSNEIKVRSTVELAGAISQEVDSGKTGYHPLNEEKIKVLNSVLDNKRPDYMDNATFDHYESIHILGQLYRASRNTLRGWNKLVRYHRHLRHLEVRTHRQFIDDEQDEGDNDDANNENEEAVIEADSALQTHVNKNHPQYCEMNQFAKKAASVYRQEMFEILNLYGLSHESDLWCRNAISGLSGELEDTAYTELDQLVDRTRTRFFNEIIIYCETGTCHQDTSIAELCNTCWKRQQAVSVACYCECYNARHASEQAPILSLPWLFATPLLQHRISQQPPPSLPQGLLSSAMHKELNKRLQNRRFRLAALIIEFKTVNEPFVGEAFVSEDVCVFVEMLQQHMEPRRHSLWPKVLSRFVCKTPSFSLLSDASEPNDEWQLVLKSRQLNDDSDYLRALKSMEWGEEQDNQMHSYFEAIFEICFEEGKQRDNSDYLKISEHIMLLFQRLAIDEMLS